MSGCEWATPPPQIMNDAVALKKKKALHCRTFWSMKPEAIMKID
jgi:hypothetical protein